MTEQGGGVADARRVEEERRIAHEGALARFAGRCARHPWRVVATWLGVVVVLIGLNAAFHGKLINDFKIPGSDTQKATDLIKAEFASEKGSVLNIVFAAPEGQRLDTPARMGIDMRASARALSSSLSP